MTGKNGWFSRLRYSMNMGLRRFMTGRYGNDKLNNAILTLGLVLCVASMFLPTRPLVLVMTSLAFLCSFFGIFRAFSRNTGKRYRENRRYLALIQRIKDREHRYYSCPKCKQSIRVPKGKGKIAITCPKCRERFIKKT